jgi:hypothetical protein
MNQASFAIPSESHNGKVTSGISQSVGSASVFSKLSTNACKLLAVFLKTGKNWFNTEMVVRMETVLSDHGVLEKGKDGVLSPMKELGERDAIE